MIEHSLSNRSKARFAGVICIIGGMMFSLYFIGLNSLLEILSPPLESGMIPALKLAISCATSLCLAGGPLGLLALGATGSGRNKTLGAIGAMIALGGLASYCVGSFYVYTSPDKALRQYFTPAGSVLITLGMLLMTIALLKARIARGWRVVAALLLSLYFPLQFPLQAMLFLGKGRGPNPILLGAWGFFCMFLGQAIRSYPERPTIPVADRKENSFSRRLTHPPNAPREVGRSAHSLDQT